MKLKQLTIILCLAGAVISAQGQTWVTNGLIAYYPFAGTSNDASAYGNNPTYVTGTYATGRFGEANGAMAFNGVNQGVIVSGFFNRLTNFPSTYPAPMTESVWMCPSNNLTPTNYFMLAGDGSSSGESYGSTLDSEGHGIKAYFYSTAGTYVNAFASTTTNFTGNTWYQVVGVFTLTNLELFINGGLQTNIAYSTTYPAIYNDLDIGAQEWNGGSGFRWGFAGRMNDVRIYNRALAANEVATLYATESQPPPSINAALAVVPSFTNLTVGVTYQLQVAGGLNGAFTNYGPTFVATNTYYQYPAAFFISASTQQYFRLYLP